MRKNKFLTFVLAICMILPAMFMVACGKSGSSNNTPAHTHTYGEWSTDETDHWHTCSGCNETEKSAHTFVVKNNAENFWQECSACGKQQNEVSATTQIANAVIFKDAEGNYYTNWQAEKADNEGTGDVYFMVKYTGNAYYAYSKYATANQEILYINSYDGEDKVKTSYKHDAGEGWTKTTNNGHTANLGTFAAKNLDIQKLSTETFTYNAEDNSYNLTQTTTSTDTYKEEYAYKLKFVDGKLVDVSVVKTKTTFATDTEEEEVATINDYTWTISYDTATIEIPSDLSVVGDTQWKEALSFKVTNFTQTIATPDRTITTKVATNCISKTSIMPAGADSTLNYYDIKNQKQYSGIIKTGEKYTVTDDSSLTFDSALNAVGNPANMYSSIKNSYTNFTYNEDKVYYIASATIDGSVYQDVELTFDNGKLVKVEGTRTNYAGEPYTTTITYTYGDTTVTVPSDSDCVFSVAYDKTNENFVLSNASLKANETKTFVINITQDMFNENDASGKCTIDGEFKVTLSGAFGNQFEKIVVKDASGNVIDNSSTDDGGFNCEITTAGKYYIEITAKTTCTGAWEIGFVG